MKLHETQEGVFQGCQVASSRPSRCDRVVRLGRRRRSCRAGTGVLHERLQRQDSHPEHRVVVTAGNSWSEPARRGDSGHPAEKQGDLPQRTRGINRLADTAVHERPGNHDRRGYDRTRARHRGRRSHPSRKLVRRGRPGAHPEHW